jgi:hypothetical protein
MNGAISSDLAERTRMNSQTKSTALISLVVLSLLVERSAYAYLDPGTGSMVLQAMIAILAAAGVALKLYWGKVKSLFGRGRGTPTGEKQP